MLSEFIHWKVFDPCWYHTCHYSRVPKHLLLFGGFCPWCSNYVEWSSQVTTHQNTTHLSRLISGVTWPLLSSSHTACSDWLTSVLLWRDHVLMSSLRAELLGSALTLGCDSLLLCPESGRWDAIWRQVSTQSVSSYFPTVSYSLAFVFPFFFEMMLLKMERISWQGVVSHWGECCLSWQLCCRARLLPSCQFPLGFELHLSLGKYGVQALVLRGVV